MSRFQEWMCDTTIEVVVHPGAVVDRALSGVCASAYDDLPPLVAPAAPVTGGVLDLAAGDGPWTVTGGLVRAPSTDGVVVLQPGTVPVTGGTVVESGTPDAPHLSVRDLRADVRGLLPAPAGEGPGPALATVHLSPPAGPVGPVAGAADLVLAPAGDGGLRTVTGGTVRIEAGRLDVGPPPDLPEYLVEAAPVWEAVLGELDGGPLGHEVARLADAGGVPEAVLRRFAVQGAIWSADPGFSLDRHLDVELAALVPDRRGAARDAASQAVALVLERLLQKPGQS